MLVDLRETLKLALPVMAARAGILVMTAVDTIMTGRFGADELAFYAVGSAPFILFMLLGIGLATGTVVLVAQAMGADRLDETGRIWRIACLDTAILGIGTAILLLPGETLLGWLGQSPEVVEGGARVMRAFALAMPAVLIFAVTSYFLEAIGRPHAGMVIMWLGNILNLLLDWLLMFGPIGIPPLGAEGAALGTSITRWAMTAAIILYAFNFKGHRAYGVRGALGAVAPIRRALLKLGFPFAASQGLESSAFQFILVMAGWLGTAQLAAHQAAINLNALFYMLTLGVATATSVRVGRAAGRRRPDEIARAGWVGVGIGVAIMVTMAPLIALFREQIGAVYTSDPLVIVVMATALLVVGPTMIVDSGQGVVTAALRGTGDTWIPTVIHVSCFWPVMVGVAWYLAFPAGLGVIGLWWGLFTGLALAFVLLGLRFAGRSRLSTPLAKAS
ncbi:MAG TPA: MATE family efflux transporter [Geminicoccus sp.]|jgi:MATE family multidrug resistance protein|uniref:MATE family efflux transporter n=1 Tax=Geminicoccus sp. TaxID=2024832 RepID=UPI002E3817FD|nr:MATE family efflux transporter [Geminicoccus sp.]HEX2529096.1 MATE family efflux transporter [Geminicoccus sp.]